MTRHINSFVSLLICTQALGCAPSVGSVTFSDLDGFSDVRSAVWLEQDASALWGEERIHHVIVLSSTPGLCEAYETAYTAYNEHMRDLDSVFSADAQCEIMRETYRDMSRDLGEYTGEGSTLITLIFMEYNELGNYGAEPSEGEHTVGNELEGVLRVYVARYLGDYYNRIEDSFVVSGDDCTVEGFIFPYPVIGFGVEWAYPEVVEFHLARDGSATVDLKGDERIDVEFDARLGDGAGDVDGQFTATHCAIEIEATNYGSGDDDPR